MAVTAAGTGCGNGTAETLSSSSLGRADFLKRANAACAQEKAEGRERAATILKLRRHNDETGEVVYADLVHFVFLPTIEAELVRIAELRPPLRDAQRIEEIMAAEKAAIDEVAVMKRIASIEAAKRHFIAAGKLFRDYGLSSCANGPVERG